MRASPTPSPARFAAWRAEPWGPRRAERQHGRDNWHSASPARRAHRSPAAALHTRDRRIEWARLILLGVGASLDIVGLIEELFSLLIHRAGSVDDGPVRLLKILFQESQRRFHQNPRVAGLLLDRLDRGPRVIFKR